MNCFSADKSLGSLGHALAMLVDVVPIAQDCSNAASPAVKLHVGAGFRARLAFHIHQRLAVDEHSAVSFRWPRASGLPCDLPSPSWRARLSALNSSRRQRAFIAR
jgi:hypothetical protein